MNNYFFQLGNTPELSLLELQAMLGEDSVVQISPQIAVAKLASDQRAKELIDLLGGTVKIIKEIEELENNNTIEENTEKVVRHLELIADGDKIHFGFSELGRDHLEKIDGFTLKSLLQKNGLNSRYVEGSRYGLSAAILLHKKRVKEVYLISTNEGVFLGSHWTDGTQAIFIHFSSLDNSTG